MSDFFLSMMLLGALSSSPQLPFWMTAGQFGLMPESNGALALVSARQDYDADKTFQWHWGASLAANTYQNTVVTEASKYNFMVDELYGGIRWKALSLDLGQKRRELDFMASDPVLGSLSTTGGHVVESGNARSMPGYLISLDPVPVPLTKKHLWLYGAFGDYRTMDERYVSKALVHRTRIGFRVDAGSHLKFHASLDHACIWGGTHPINGPMPVTLQNYLRMILGLPAGKDGSINDQLNVIGDQRGGELFRAEWHEDAWSVVLQHDIPYDDGSGMGFLNFPDGVNTLHFGFKDKDRWVSDIVLEYQYTMYQSGPINVEFTGEQGKTTGGDNYFNNGEYKSGWTHFGHTIGNPLFYPDGTHDGSWTSAEMTLGVENNRLRAWHVGLSGKLFKRSPYRLMLTASNNYGTYFFPYVGESVWGHEWGSVKETGLFQFSAAFSGFVPSIFRMEGMGLQYGLYADAGKVLVNSMGMILGLRYSF